MSIRKEIVGMRGHVQKLVCWLAPRCPAMRRLRTVTIQSPAEQLRNRIESMSAENDQLRRDVIAAVDLMAQLDADAAKIETATGRLLARLDQAAAIVASLELRMQRCGGPDDDEI